MECVKMDGYLCREQAVIHAKCGGRRKIKIKHNQDLNAHYSNWLKE
jgi:hypothetical protein